MPHQARGVEANVLAEGHLDHVAQALVGARRTAKLDRIDVVAASDHALRVEEPQR